MRKIKFYRLDPKRAIRLRFKHGNLPGNQTLIWIGPLFIHISPK